MEDICGHIKLFEEQILKSYNTYLYEKLPQNCDLHRMQMMNYLQILTVLIFLWIWLYTFLIQKDYWKFWTFFFFSICNLYIYNNDAKVHQKNKVLWKDNSFKFSFLKPYTMNNMFRKY